MILFGYYFTHAGTTDPIAETDGISATVVIVKLLKTIHQEVSPPFVRKMVPFTFVPMVRKSVRSNS